MTAVIDIAERIYRRIGVRLLLCSSRHPTAMMLVLGTVLLTGGLVEISLIMLARSPLMLP